MAQAAETQGTKYKELREKVNKLGGLIFKLSDCKNLDSPEKLEKLCEYMKEIYLHLTKYTIVVMYLKITKKMDIKIRQYLAQRFMEANSIGIFTKFLNKMTSEILKNEGNGKDSPKFDCVHAILNILIFIADADLDFGEKICEEDDLLTFFYKILDGLADSIVYDDYSTSNYKSKVVETVVAILYKTLIHGSMHNIMKMRQHKFVNIIKGFVDSDSNRLNILALFFTSYVADEINVHLTAEEQKLLRHVVSLLENVSPYGFSSMELAKGILQLSKHDDNKMWLVYHGILNVLHQVLNKGSMEIQKTYLLILWSLAFYDNTKKEIKKKFLEKIENMRNNLDKFDEETDTAEFLSHFNDIIHMKSESGSGIEELRQTLDNVLWVLKNEDEPSPNELCTETPGEMMMISYCNEDEEVVKRIYNELKKKEYEVWIDFENKGDETMEAKAVAMKQAKAVIICESYGYQSSEICRQEITYARKLRKCLVPFIVKKDFTPTGWLGGDLIGLPRFDMSGKCENSETSMSKLKDYLDDHELKRFKICSICHERAANCGLECGHKFCIVCSVKLLSMSNLQCQICSAESKIFDNNL